MSSRWSLLRRSGRALGQLTGSASTDTQYVRQLSERQAAGVPYPPSGLGADRADLGNCREESLAQVVGCLEGLEVVECTEMVERGHDGLVDPAELIAAHEGDSSRLPTLDSG